MNKRGASAIIDTIMKAIPFIIVIGLLFFISIKLFGDTLQEEKDICQFSVLSRATVPESINDYIPLQCTTQKICITNTKESECNEFIGEKATIVNIEGKTTRESAKTIEKTIANEMYDCWKMMGQGELSLFSGGLGKTFSITPQEVTCNICTRIAFDLTDETRKTILTSTDINTYLRTTPVPNTETSFLESFTDKGINSYTYAPSTQELYNRATENQKIEEIGKTDKEGEDDEIAIIFSQIFPEDFETQLIKLGIAGAVVAGATFVAPGIGTAAGLALVGIGTGGAATYSMSNLYNGRTAAAGYCGKVSSTYKPENEKDSANKGCSAVQVLPYKFAALKSVCKRIEGNP